MSHHFFARPIFVSFLAVAAAIHGGRHLGRAKQPGDGYCLDVSASVSVSTNVDCRWGNDEQPPGWRDVLGHRDWLYAWTDGEPVPQSTGERADGDHTVDR
jgi:hypothetical protein